MVESQEEPFCPHAVEIYVYLRGFVLTRHRGVYLSGDTVVCFVNDLGWWIWAEFLWTSWFDVHNVLIYCMLFSLQALHFINIHGFTRQSLTIQVLGNELSY